MMLFFCVIFVLSFLTLLLVFRSRKKKTKQNKAKTNEIEEKKHIIDSISHYIQIEYLHLQSLVQNVRGYVTKITD